jgi:MATE family multidrug resistance protein
MIGVNTALETFISQAWGRKNPKDCGLYLHRALFIITLVYVPVVFLTFYYETFLLKIGVDPHVANMAQQYVIVYLPGALINTYVDSIDMLLIATEHTSAICVIMSACLPFHAFFCYTMMFKFDYGFIGAAFAVNLTAIISLIFTLVYTKTLKGLNDAFFFPTKRTFNNLITFLETAIPGTIMLLLENTNMQIMVLMASLLNNNDQLAAMTIVIFIGDFIMMIPYGLALGSCTLVGNTLGRNKPRLALANTKMVTVVSLMFSIGLCLIIIMLRRRIINIYTDD